MFQCSNTNASLIIVFIHEEFSRYLLIPPIIECSGTDTIDISGSTIGKSVDEGSTDGVTSGWDGGGHGDDRGLRTRSLFDWMEVKEIEKR